MIFSFYPAQVVPSQTGSVKHLSFKCAEKTVSESSLAEPRAYENGTFKFIRVLNGDQTDGGLDFRSEPLVLRVSIATC